MHMIIIGGGLGGLSLAQALPAAGVEATVYERDPDPFARGQGYRIHLNPEADAILSECLPAPVYQHYRDTSGETEGGRVFLMTSELTVIADEAFHDRYNYEGPVSDAVVDRLTFRQALSSGLDVRYGKACTGFEHLPDGRVRAVFADGTDAVGDVLIGADGINSAIRRQLQPDATLFDTGLRLIYGRTPLAEVRLPEWFARGFAIITGPAGVNMAVGWFERRDDPSQSYLMWALVSGEENVPATLAGADPDTLRATALARTTTWHPTLRQVIERGEGLTFLRMRSSAPSPPWPTGPVTLLGDAAHPMFPAGSGTLVALRDVRLLRNALQEAAAGKTPLLTAIKNYESAMFSYAWQAVRESYDMAERLGAIPWPHP